MRTSKPFSMISYNSTEYLEEKLNEMVKAKMIEEYRYIKHDGEDGDKDHIHLWVKPNKRIDTMEFSEEMNEIDPFNPTKPLTCIGARNSSEEDWVLYTLHDEEYLRAHFSDNDGDGKKPYSITDIRTNEEELLKRCYKRALENKKGKWSNVKKELDMNYDPVDIITRYNINPTQFNSFLTAYSHYKAKAQNVDIYDLDLDTGELKEKLKDGELYNN